MEVLGIDFTSSPSKRKPLTCISATYEGTTLSADTLREWPDFDALGSTLNAPGPWIAGIDFPFGQSRQFIENSGLPASWQGYVDFVAGLTRPEWREFLENYKKHRGTGDKEHRRKTDSEASSISPQKLYGVPVALMFYEGAPRIRRSGATIPGLQEGDPNRVVIEAYPALLARKVIGRRSYKHDTRAKQTSDQAAARRELLGSIVRGALTEEYGFSVEAPSSLADDPTGDHVDALLCAIQAAWAWSQRERAFGAPDDTDTLEGWIADPVLR